MNVVRFVKGCTTIKELEELPSRYLHVLYKEYLLVQFDDKLKKAHEESSAVEEIVDEMT